MNKIINFNDIIGFRDSEEIFENIKTVENFIIADEYKSVEVDILNSWREYFDEYNIPYIITKEVIKRFSKGRTYHTSQFILWKDMPYGQKNEK